MNESSNFKLILDKVTRSLPLAMTFLVPIFFLPFTTEFFEMSKLALLTVGTLLMLALLIVKVLAGQRIHLVKSVMDLPLWGFGLVIILSTIFSIDKTASIFGSYGRWFPSLLSYIALVAYFHLASSSLTDGKTLKNGIYLLISSVSISTLVALLSYFRIPLGSASYVRVNGFTLTGSTTTAAVLAGVGAVMAFAFLAYERNKSLSFGLVAATAINALYVLLAGITVGWIVMGAGLVGIVTYVNIQRYSGKRTEMVTLAGVLIALVLAMVLPTTKDLIVNKAYPQETTLSLRNSWEIASSIARDFPVLGTGPSTFSLNFPRYRNVNLNQGDAWNARFDKPHNEIFNIVGNLGLVGLMATLFLASKLIKLVNSTKSLEDPDGLTAVSSVALLAITVSLFGTYATVLTAFLFITALTFTLASHAVAKESTRLSEVVRIDFASVSAVSSLGGEAKMAQESYTKYVVSVPLLLLAGYFGFLNYKNYMAEVYMRQALLSAATDGARTYELQARAINMHPQRDIYHTTYAQTNLTLANVLAAKENLTDADRQTIQTLIAQAIRSSRIATEVVNPLNVNNWETRAVVYRSLVNVANNAAEWSIRAYNNAIQLDPTNPRLRLNLGGVYYATGDYLSAANQFRQSTALKTDYANAYYNFGQALKELNNYNNAIAALEISKNLVGRNSADFKRVEKELAELRQNPQVAGAQANKPTVEEIAGPTVNEQPAGQQEPLVNTGEEQVQQEGLNPDQLPPREQNVVEGQPQPQEPAPAPAPEEQPAP